MATVQILAPFAGWCMPLADVPDAVFAGGMLGAGLAVDPVSAELCSPVDGVVVTAAATGHAVTLRTAEGIELLVHLGIDTVHLAGRGFEMRVAPGQKVTSGEALIRFDLDAVARAAKSVVTPIVITRADGFEVRALRAAGMVRTGDVLFECVATAGSADAAVASAAASGASAHTPRAVELVRTLRMPLRHGLHARPAALLAQRLKTLAAEVSFASQGRAADARSVVAIMALGVRHDDELTVTARGAAAEQALAAFGAALDEALRLEGAADASARESEVSRADSADAGVASAGAGAGSRLGGVRAAPGFAVGVATPLSRRNIEVTEPGQGVAQERATLERALAQVRAELTSGVAGSSAATGGAGSQIAAAHAEFLDDPQLLQAAQADIADGKSAGFAWRTAVRAAAAALESLADPRLRERVDDLLDIERRVLLQIVGKEHSAVMALPEGAVLIAQDLLPSELVALEPARLAAICLAAGGATSHVAILAAAMGVPMLVSLGARLAEVREGATLVVDADGGTLDLAPDAAAVGAARASTAARRARQQSERAAAQHVCTTLDGTRIKVFANLGQVSDAVAAVANGAEGCGLLRTEFLFLERETAPDEAEQLDAYQGIADALAGRPLVLRLMDIGGDKPLRYLPFPHEENPALGLRGIRAALWRPDLLRTQLRAALRVQPVGVVQLLLPMITDVAEVEAVRAVIAEVRAELGSRAEVEVGAMIETPAAALMATQIARVTDFLSIGSNDLTQYTLAMDRGHAELARRMDALHPAVLRMIAAAASAGTAAGKLVAVCGGVAADNVAVPLLLGLGVRELSVVPAAVPAIKQRVRELTLGDCEQLALRCLELGSAEQVRRAVQALKSDGGAR